MKKIIAIFLLLSFLATGCTRGEKKILEIDQKIRNIDNVDARSIIEITFDKSVDEMKNREDDSEEFDFAEMLYILEENKIICEEKVYYNEGKAYGNVYFYLQPKGKVAKIPVFEIAIDGDVVYFYVGKLISIMDTYGNDEIRNALDKLPQDLEYVYMYFDEDDMRHYSKKIYSRHKLGQEISMAAKILTEGIFKSEQLLTVKRHKGEYICNINIEQIGELYSKFFSNVIRKNEKFTKDIELIVENLDNNAEIFKVLIDEYSDDEAIVENTEKGSNDDDEIAESEKGFMLLEIENGSDILKDSLNNVFSEFNLKLIVSEIDNKKYSWDYELDTKLKENDLGLRVTVKSTYMENKDKYYYTPVSRYYSLDEIIETFVYEVILDPSEKKAWVNSELAAREADINVKVIGNKNYFEIRQISELLADRMIWDTKEKKPYFIKGMDKIYLDVNIIEGKSYILIKEFEKLGYIVSWNNETKKISVKK
ncbi:MAG: hypothetical protein N4A47_02480 [Clostridia bacterium]|jgi:hypothetical protein|nr:hypothetical protein [Clostridia bacterium]